MAIIIDQEQKLLTPHTITLHTKNTTYQMAVGAYGQLLHLYYGPRLDGDMRYLLTYYDRGVSGNPYEAECDKTYSMDALPQEYPCFGTGDFRSPAFVLKNADGSYCADLRFVSCEVCKGKYQIPGLPAVYDETGTESETLKVYLEDAGECYGCMLLYSGNFKAEAEKDQYEQTRLVMGLSDEMFSCAFLESAPSDPKPYLPQCIP